MSPLNDKVVLVTGASSGIGFAISQEFARRGYKVFAGARRLSKMKPLEELGIILIELDITSQESLDNAKKIVEKKSGRLDVLFNNAGVSCSFPAVEVPDEAFSHCFDVNVNGHIRAVKTFFPLIRASRGAFVFTTSTASQTPFPFGSIYSASKAAIRAYVSTLALEVKPFGITVVDFITGAVISEMSQKTQVEHLPENSAYIFEGTDLYQIAQTLDIKKMPAAKYARSAVSDVEYAMKGGWFNFTNYFHFYEGSSASAPKFVNFFLPRFLIEKIYLTVFNLSGWWDKLYTKEKLKAS